MTCKPSAAQAKACCASAYSHDAVALVLGDSHHPGGLRLTRRLVRTAGIAPGQRVLDVASGPGSTALLLAEEYDVEVVGVDLSDTAVAKAAQTAKRFGLAHRARFHQADAERLPLPDNAFDVVICECALCTFPDKAAAAAEFARVLGPGGRLALSDVTVAPDGLPAELAGLAGWVACLADAQPTEQYAGLLTAAGLQVRTIERHDDALAAMVEQVEARLIALRALGHGPPLLAGADLSRALELVALARRAVDDKVAGYALLVAELPMS